MPRFKRGERRYPVDWRIFLKDLGASFDQFGSKVSAFLPNLIGSVIILVFGVIIARAVKVLSRKFLWLSENVSPGLR